MSIVAEILDAGPLSLIEDTGRFGYQDIGISPGGAMDDYAYNWANLLVGNPAGSACIEITFGPFQFIALEDIVIAITGADPQAQLKRAAPGAKVSSTSTPLPAWENHKISAGDIVEFSQAQHGLRTYLAFQGGLNTPIFMGSHSTTLRENMGGFSGAKLKNGQVLPVHQTRRHISKRRVPDVHIPAYPDDLVVRFIPSATFQALPRLEQSRFIHHPYQVSHSSDRMGYRLQGPKITSSANGIISQGTTLGLIQLPADGQPIVLMKERQTIGGYPTLGTIFQVDAFKLGQQRPGTSVCFYPDAIENAQAEWLLFNTLFNTMQENWGISQKGK